ncbi:MAG: hypothetical protein ACYSW3_00205 [Planctomycetota bacterium]|jgi:hypothetical protein
MTQFRCCKCDTLYPFILFGNDEGELPLIKCPECGEVHTVEVQTSNAIPVDPLDELRAKDYYINVICDSRIGTDVASPVGVEDPVGQLTTSKFWVGLRAWNNAGKEPISTTFTLDWQRDSAGWNTLAATGELKWAGNNNMVVTDPTPATGIFFCSSCGGTPEDGAAVDDSAACALDISSGGDSEWWWGIDPAGATAGSTYTFRVNDNRGQFTNTLLAASITFLITYNLVVQEAYHTHEGGIWNDTIPLIVPLTVAECGHLIFTNDDNSPLTIVEVEGAIDLVIAPDPYHTHHPTNNEIAAFGLTISTAEAYHILTDNQPLWWIDDAAHVLTNDAITGFDLWVGVAEAYHVLTDDDPLWWVAEAYHVLTNDPINPFSVRGSFHLLVDDGPITITEEGAIDLTVQEAYHVLTNDLMMMGFDHCAHVLTNDAVTLVVTITVQEAYHTFHTNDVIAAFGITLSTTEECYHTFHPTSDEFNPFSVRGAFHLLVDDGPIGLTSGLILEVAECGHESFSDVIDLAQHFLSTNDCYHVHAADNVALAVLLAVQESAHVLTDDDWIWINDAAHVLTNDAVALTVTHVLTVAEAFHVLTNDAITGFDFWINVAESHNILFSDNINIDTSGTLTVSEVFHDHVVDSLVLSQNLTISDCFHPIITDAIALEQKNVLQNLDTYHLVVTDWPVTLGFTATMGEVGEDDLTISSLTENRYFDSLTSKRALHHV